MKNQQQDDRTLPIQGFEPTTFLFKPSTLIFVFHQSITSFLLAAIDRWGHCHQQAEPDRVGAQLLPLNYRDYLKFVYANRNQDWLAVMS